MSKKDILILGIETSCDETSASVVKNGRMILSNVISSQISIHKKYGGVVPEIASRKHLELVIPVVDEALDKAQIKLSDVDAVGVTYGPGLVGALLVGVSCAKALSFSGDIPLVGVNHIEGHIASNYLEVKELTPPFICLVVSGGHSHIILVNNYNEFRVLGKTRDDAAGEAFDKIARVIGLGYPGGPLIDKWAKYGNENAVTFPRVKFENSFDFSFSGLKTAVINHVNRIKQMDGEFSIPDIAASFQRAVVDVLVANTVNAAKRINVAKIVLAGGVASNSLLRKTMIEKCKDENIWFSYPSPVLCTDNAAMIASAAYYKLIDGKVSDLSLNAVSNLRFEDYVW